MEEDNTRFNDEAPFDYEERPCYKCIHYVTTKVKEGMIQKGCECWACDFEAIKEEEE